MPRRWRARRWTMCASTSTAGARCACPQASCTPMLPARRGRRSSKAEARESLESLDVQAELAGKRAALARQRGARQGIAEPDLEVRVPAVLHAQVCAPVPAVEAADDRLQVRDPSRGGPTAGDAPGEIQRQRRKRGRGGDLL